MRAHQQRIEISLLPTVMADSLVTELRQNLTELGSANNWVGYLYRAAHYLTQHAFTRHGYFEQAARPIVWS